MGEGQPIEPAKGRTRALMLLGLQGTGKTSTAAKLALYLKKQGDRPLLVAADVRRPAAREQLRVLGESIGVPVFSREGDDAPAICAEAIAFARENHHGTVILDTAGRLQIDDELMRELEEIAERTKPEHTTLICDAMMGREAVNVARGFAARIPLDGLILTKLDGDSRGGAALAIRAATGVPIRFVAMGEATDKLEAFRPEGLAQRVLGQGDVVGLMQDFEAVVDVEEAEKDAERMLRGKFSFEDFLSQLRTIQKMGSLTDLLAKIPGVSDMMPEGAKVDPGELQAHRGDDHLDDPGGAEAARAHQLVAPEPDRARLGHQGPRRRGPAAALQDDARHDGAARRRGRIARQDPRRREDVRRRRRRAAAARRLRPLRARRHGRHARQPPRACARRRPWRSASSARRMKKHKKRGKK